MLLATSGSTDTTLKVVRTLSFSPEVLKENEKPSEVDKCSAFYTVIYSAGTITTCKMHFTRFGARILAKVVTGIAPPLPPKGGKTRRKLSFRSPPTPPGGRSRREFSGGLRLTQKRGHMNKEGPKPLPTHMRGFSYPDSTSSSGIPAFFLSASPRVSLSTTTHRSCVLTTTCPRYAPGTSYPCITQYRFSPFRAASA